MSEQEKSVCEEVNYRQLYEKHANHLRNFMYYKCGDLQQAEDHMHEAFSRMWERCTEVIFDKAKSYLFTIANRLFLNQIQHSKVVLEFEKSSSTVQNNEDPEFELRHKEFKSKLEKAISELNEGQREVFLMNRIDKLSYTEIAERLGLSVKAIEKRMGIALKTLKGQLKELNDYKI